MIIISTKIILKIKKNNNIKYIENKDNLYYKKKNKK